MAGILTQDSFQLLFEQNADPMWLFDPGRGVFVDCNRAAVELVRAASKEALLPCRPEQLAPEVQPDGVSSADRAREIIAEASAQGRHRFEWWARRLDGEVFPVEVTVTLIQLGDGSFHLTVVRDITARKRAEEALRESQELLGSVAEKMSEAIYRNNLQDGLTFVNPAYLHMFGYDSLEDLRQVPRERLYADPADRAHLLELLEREGGFTHQEVRYRRKDGSHFWGLSSSRAVYAADGRTISYHVGTILDITERKQSQDAIRELNQTLERRVHERTADLKASEARLRTLVEHATEAIVVFEGETGRFEECNQNAIKLFGLSRERLLQCTPADVSPAVQPDGRNSVEAARTWIAAARKGRTPEFEWMHRHASGRLIPCEIRLVRLPSDSNPGCRIRGSIIDNTARQRRESVQRAIYQISEAVQSSENLHTLYRRIHEIIQGLMPARNFYIALFDAATGLISFPYYVDAVSSVPEPMKPTTGLTGYVLRTGKALLVNRKMPKRRVGEAVIFEGLQETPYVEAGAPAAIWLGVPLLVQGRKLGVMAVQDYESDEVYSGEDQQILTFVADQTALAIDRKRSDQARRESEEKFRALFEASSQAVMLHDEEKFIQVNPAALRILGFAPEELIGKHPADMAAPIQPTGERADVLFRKYIADCLAKGSARFDWLCRNNRGQDIPVEVILTRIPWGGRQIIQAVINDITERKKAEAELLRALARERELSSLKSSFVSMISHEFRTPLSIILSSAEILDAYLDRLDPSERREHLDSIQKNSRRMASLMEEVLLLGQADAGRLEFKPESINLGALMQRLIDEVLTATNHRCPIRFRTEQFTQPAIADERLLRHVFTNLLSNAIKYSADESPVDLQMEKEGAEVVFRVSDRGIGIPPQDLGWLFNSFHRGRNVGQRPGTGLGLVIVKRCVERHGGAIHLHSLEGEGTTVVVRLPLMTGASNVPLPLAADHQRT